MKHRAPRTPPAGREIWPDVVKGACIVLIVLWHVIVKHFQFLDGYADLPQSSFWNWFVHVPQPVRMPLFFAVAGMFATAAIARPLGVLVRTRIAKFAYLYVVWLLIHTAVMSFTPQVRTAHAQSAGQLIELITINPTNLWFLYALALYFTIARIVRQLRVRPVYVLAAAAMLSAATAAQLLGDPSNRSQVLQNLLFFLIGLYGRDQLTLLARSSQGRLLLAYLALYAGGVAAMRLLDAEAWFGVWTAVSLIGIALGVVTAALVARHARRTTAILVHLGRRTLPIYVMHLPLLAVLEQLAWHFDLLPPTGAYAAAGPVVLTAVLIAGCLGLERLLRQLRAGFLFEPPFAARPRMRSAA